jgi:antitoxin MazE
MTTVMTRVITIGNSRGIRIPKVLLDQIGLKKEEQVELAVERDRLIIRPVRRLRHDWDDQFKLMAQRGDDRLLDAATPSLTRWDAEEWEWS